MNSGPHWMRGSRFRSPADRLASLALIVLTLSGAATTGLRPCTMHGAGHASEPAGEPSTASDAPTRPDADAGGAGRAEHTAAAHHAALLEADDPATDHSDACDCLATCLTCCGPALSVADAAGVGVHEDTSLAASHLARGAPQGKRRLLSHRPRSPPL